MTHVLPEQVGVEDAREKHMDNQCCSAIYKAER